MSPSSLCKHIVNEILSEFISKFNADTFFQIIL